MESCIFCKIAKREVPSDVVRETDDILVFEDLHPKAPTHLLFIPKMHIQSVAHLEAEHEALVGKLMLLVKDVAAERKLPGYKVIANVGREGGQVVDHLHFHLLGGWNNENPNQFKV